MQRMIIILIVLLAALAACTPPTGEPDAQETETPATSPATEPAATPQPSATAQPSATTTPEEPALTPVEEVAPLEPLPTIPPPQTPATIEAPAALLEELKADLSERIGVPVDAIAVEFAQSVIWRDGSLGCPQPGMMYTMALEPGYRVILVAEAMQYDYHTSERGGFVLCEDGGQIDPGSNLLPTE